MVIRTPFKRLPLVEREIQRLCNPKKSNTGKGNIMGVILGDIGVVVGDMGVVLGDMGVVLGD